MSETADQSGAGREFDAAEAVCAEDITGCSPAPGVRDRAGTSLDQILRTIGDLETQLGVLRDIQSHGEAAEAELARRNNELRDRLDELESSRAEAERLRELIAAFEAGGAVLSRERDELRARRDELEHEAGRMLAETERLGEQLAELRSAEAAIVRERDELRARHDELLKDAGEARAEAEELCRRVAGQERRIESLEAESRQARSDADAALAAAEELEGRVARLAGAEAELVTTIERADALAARADDADAEVSRLTDDLGEVRSELVRRSAEAASLASRLERTEAEKETLAAQLDGLRAAAERLPAVESDLTSSRLELEERSERLAAAEMRIAELEDFERGAEMAGRKLAELKQEVSRLTERLSATDTRRAELENQLTRVASGGAGATVPETEAYRLSQLEEELTVRERAIEALAERVRRANAERETLETDLAAARREVASLSGADDGSYGGAAWSAGRRRRLARVQVLLETEARKLVQARDAIAGRHREAEQIIAKRHTLARASEQIAKRESRVTKLEAGSKAWRGVAYAAITLAILAGLSWSVVTRAVPATYAATAVISADSGARTPSPSDLAAWQSFHQRLTLDAALIERAAERMAQRGIVTLASPAVLSRTLRDGLYIQSTRDGELELEIRGEGRERTERVLDTYVTTLVSESNAARGSRTDGLAAEVASPAAAADDPIEDQRPIYAGGLLGGLVAATALFGLVIWSHMVRGHRKLQAERALETRIEGLDLPPAPRAD